MVEFCNKNGGNRERYGNFGKLPSLAGDGVVWLGSDCERGEKNVGKW